MSLKLQKREQKQRVFCKNTIKASRFSVKAPCNLPAIRRNKRLLYKDKLKKAEYVG